MLKLPFKLPALVVTIVPSLLVASVFAQNADASALYALDNLGANPNTSLWAFGLTPRADYQGKVTGDFMWMNSYRVEEGGEILNSISLTWGLPNSAKGSTGFSNLAEPQLASLLIYGDPNGDGNPNDANLLAQSDVYITGADSSALTKVMITPTQMQVGQNFFVAALVRNLERIPDAKTGEFQNQSPATTEINNNKVKDPSKVGRSWYAIGNHGDSEPSNFNINDLSQNYIPPASANKTASLPQSPIALPITSGNWVLRAEGQAAARHIPEPTMTFGLLGLGIAHWIRRRRR
jgi:hypothetical protein